MASPQSEPAPAAAPVKAVDAEPAHESAPAPAPAPTTTEAKPETNGHASPAPVANGNGETAHHESQNTDDVASNQSVSAKPDEPSQDVAMGDAVEAAESKAEETKAESPKEPVQADEPTESKEAQPEQAPKPTEPESAPEKKPDADSAPSQADVDMADATEAPAAETTADTKSPAKPESPTTSAPAPPAEDTDQPTSLSQLAIDSKEEADADVNMADASAAPAKVAREREEDTPDEPAAKRAKTEPSEDEKTPQAPAPEPAAAPATDAPAKSEHDAVDTAFRGLDQWNDGEVNSREITPYRVREYRRVLAGAKKTKAGAGFRDAVAKLWPVLAENYIARVEKPMDIGLMERNLRDGSIYKTLGDLKKDLALLYYNTYIYNGAIHEVTLTGKAAVEQIWHRFIEVPANEPPKSKPQAKHNPTRHSEPRPAAAPAAAPAPAPRKESRPTPASPAARADAEVYAVPPGGVPQVRRASTQNESDRPKRTIHPPKSRDVDYTATQNFNKKKLPLELQFAYDVLTEVSDLKHEIVNGPFLAPVDPVALQIPNYWSIVKKPMDLGTMKGKLVNGEYQTLQQVQQDIKLIVGNCVRFNGNDHPVTFQANQLADLAKSKFAKKDQWMARNTPAKVADESSAESEEESEEEDQAAAQAKTANTAAIAHLERRLQDETAKLTDLIINVDVTDDSMIDVQRTIINAIRKKLIEEKEKLAAHKPEKPAKGKAGKSAGKAKAAPGKKAGGAAAGRKSGGGPRKKRNMTQAEKDAIANGINDLDESHITKAIDIIKKDTGQSENDSGELELEIDALSTDALHKLWDLLKKVLPGFGASITPPQEPAAPSNGAAKAKSAPGKPKKNKPMNAREQEARIAELERLKQSYQAPGQEPADREPEMPLHPLREDSSDSEEE